MIVSISVEYRFARKEVDLRFDEFAGGKLRGDGVGVRGRRRQLRLGQHKDRRQLSELLRQHHRQQATAQKGDDPCLSALNPRPFDNVHERRSRAEPVAHLSTHLHHVLVVVVTRSVPKCRVEGVVRVFHEWLYQHDLEAFA